MVKLMESRNVDNKGSCINYDDNGCGNSGDVPQWYSHMVENRGEYNNKAKARGYYIRKGDQEWIGIIKKKETND